MGTRLAMCRKPRTARTGSRNGRKAGQGSNRRIGPDQIAAGAWLERAIFPVLADEAAEQARAFVTADLREGATAFSQKRPPVFVGH